MEKYKIEQFYIDVTQKYNNTGTSFNEAYKWNIFFDIYYDFSCLDQRPHLYDKIRKFNESDKKMLQYTMHVK